MRILDIFLEKTRRTNLEAKVFEPNSISYPQPLMD